MGAHALQTEAQNMLRAKYTKQRLYLGQLNSCITYLVWNMTACWCENHIWTSSALWPS